MYHIIYNEKILYKLPDENVKRNICRLFRSKQRHLQKIENLHARRKYFKRKFLYDDTCLTFRYNFLRLTKKLKADTSRQF